MAPVSFKSARLFVSADVPEPMARLLRRMRARFRAIRATERRGRLVFADSMPRLEVEKRDPSLALASFRTRPDRSPAAGDGVPRSLAQEVAEIAWYHTIELPDGTLTPGAFDHRDLVSRYPLPDDLHGQRVLDVGTFDGFWAFEFERRGAQVVAADLPRFAAVDLPDLVRAALDEEGLDREFGLGFKLAHRELESNVQYVPCSVYDLDPEVLGTFDLVHISDVLLHLENPIRALRSIRRMTAGKALIVDAFDPRLGADQVTRYGGGWVSVLWWLPSLKTLGQMISDAGFSSVELHSVFNLAGVPETEGLWRAALIAKP